MSMAWIYLLLAGLFEIGWPAGLKISQSAGKFGYGFALAVLSMTVSGALLWLAQRDIPIGTAYAVWTGIGAAGTFLIGVMFFGDTLNAMRAVSLTLIVCGVIGLKLASLG